MSKVRSVRGRRARSLILWAIAVVLGIHGGLMCWTTFASPYLEDKEFEERYAAYSKRWRQAHAKGRETMVIVGSSRLEWGLYARIVEETIASRASAAPMVHNFGFSGAGPLIDWAIVRRLIASPVPPDRVVIEINPIFYHTRDGAAYETPRLVREKIFPCERKSLDRLGWRQVNAAHWSDECVPAWSRGRANIVWWSLRKKLTADERRGDHPPPDDWGDANLNVPTPDPASRAILTKRSKDAYCECLQNLEVEATTRAAMDDVLALCRAKGIRVAFFIMPESDAFREWYVLKSHAAIDGLLRHLAAGQDAAFFDARLWFPDPAIYYDSHHLLDDGARRFSRRFADECLVSWIAEQSRTNSGPFQTTSFPRSK